MPLGRYPERVKPFKSWSQKQVDDAKLSGSVTPKKSRTRTSKTKSRKRRRRRKVTQD